MVGPVVLPSNVVPCARYSKLLDLNQGNYIHAAPRVKLISTAEGYNHLAYADGRATGLGATAEGTKGDVYEETGS